MKLIRDALQSTSRTTKILGVAILGVVLYLVGLKLLLLPLLVGLLVAYLPLPAIFSSVISRMFVAFLASFSLLQIAATLQFLLFPRSNFLVLAIVAVVLHAALLLVVPKQESKKIKLFSPIDIGGLLSIAFFAVVFAPIFIGDNSIARIAEIGSLQAIDATNHYAGISEMAEAQHFTYEPGYYYPKGFHISIGFIQQTIFGAQYDLGWRDNVLLYFGQYVVMGILLAYSIYVFAYSWLRRFAKGVVDAPKTHVLLAFCVGPIVALLYLLPFVAHGFLNYYYVIATILVASVFMIELQKQEEPLSSEQGRYAVLMFLLLIFGASVSWPLLIPPLLLMMALFVLPNDGKLGVFVKSLFKPAYIPLVVLLLLQFLPIYFQLAYSGTDSSQGINLTGGLKTFHPFVLLAGFGVVMWVMLRSSTDKALRQLVVSIFMPIFAFIGLLVLMQYFTVGEIRYYVIKSSLLLEIMVVVFAIALLVASYLSGKKSWKLAVFLPVAPVLVMLLLISTATNPLKDVRDLFRDAGHQEKPAMIDTDVTMFEKLGTEGKLKHFNATLLHYNAENNKFYAHMQAAFWANMMQYDSSKTDFKALHCIGALYSNLGFGTFSDKEQEQLVIKVKECAQKVKDLGGTFYIVTDQASAEQIRNTFGDLVEVVY